MASMRRIGASLLAITGLALIAAAAVGASNPHPMYTCVTTNPNGHTTVLHVPEPAVSGLTNAVFTCVPDDSGNGGGSQGGGGDNGGDGGGGDGRQHGGRVHH